MCFVDVTFFSSCTCIFVSFANLGHGPESAFASPGEHPATFGLNLPGDRSQVRLACEYSGLFCPQRLWYSSYKLEMHNGPCRKMTGEPRMTFGGLQMHYEWFKGFVAFDCSSKAWGQHESNIAGITPYRPLYTTRELDSYVNEDLELVRPVEMADNYKGARSWIPPMYILLGSSGVQSMSPRRPG